MTTLGDFLKLLVTIYLSKVAQMFGDFWGSYENITFMYKKPWLLFWATLEKIGQLFKSIIWSHCEVREQSTLLHERIKIWM